LSGEWFNEDKAGSLAKRLLSTRMGQRATLANITLKTALKKHCVCL